MRLIEAIIDANHRALRGDKGAGLHPAEHEQSLPLVALTCIDPRLNPLIPEVLGVPEDQFIWLRNAGNIIYDSMSSMTRTLALGCAIKGGREIAIIGHTDCKVRQTSVLELTDRFKALGIERARLPENLTDFFGLFASERQNVIRGVEFVRQSPLIGRKVPVHGLVVDIESGKLEWVVNGYQALETVAAEFVRPAAAAAAAEASSAFAPFTIGSSSQVKIGEMETTLPPAAAWPEPATVQEHAAAPAAPEEAVGQAHSQAEPRRFRLRIDPGAHYKVMDAAKKVFGPISGRELEQWVTEGRIDLNTLAQKLGYKEWRPLETLIEKQELPSIPIPPPIAAALRFGIDKAGKKKRGSS